MKLSPGKFIVGLAALILIGVLMGAVFPPPLLRNAWSTNAPGTPVLGNNDLSVTNVGSGTNWLFYGINSNTVARLGDITASGSSGANLGSGDITIYDSTLAAILQFNTLRLAGQGMVRHSNANTFVLSNSFLAQPTNANLTDWSQIGTNSLTEKLASNVWQSSWGALSTNALTGKLDSNTYFTAWGSLSTNSIANAASNLVVVLPGTNTSVTKTSTNGTNFYAVSSSGGGGTPAGSYPDLQFNNAGSFGAIVSPNTNQGFGNVLQFVGTNAVWIGPDAGWAIDEEFMGISSSVPGREPWTFNLASGGTLLMGAGEPGVYGFVESVVTNTPDRAALFSSPSTLNNLTVTNLELLLSVRVRLKQTNDSTDRFSLEIGLMDAVLSPPTRGIYFRVTNNVWQGITRNSSIETIGSLSNLTANEWTWLVAHLDYTGTNVYFMQGGAPDTMALLATNSSNIPSGGIAPITKWTKFTGATTRGTNQLDVFKLWARRL